MILSPDISDVKYVGAANVLCILTLIVVVVPSVCHIIIIVIIIIVVVLISVVDVGLTFSDFSFPSLNVHFMLRRRLFRVWVRVRSSLSVNPVYVIIMRQCIQDNLCALVPVLVPVFV